MSALACTSHLLVDLPLFGAPVLSVAGTVLLIRRGERRRVAVEGQPGDETPSASAVLPA